MALEVDIRGMVKAKKVDFNLDVEEMAKAGLHFGHRTSKIHPKMMPYLGGVKNTVHIIDLEKAKEKLEEALKFIQGLILEKKILLVVGTKIQVKDLVKDMATECGLPYVNERWLGGTFTNFPSIKKRIEYFKDLELVEFSGVHDDGRFVERVGLDEFSESEYACGMFWFRKR